MSFRRFTEEQVEQANRVNLIEYAKQHGYPVVEYAKGYYKISGYGGLLLDPMKNCWYWEEESCSGKCAGGGPIQFVMRLEHKSWVEAVKTLLDKADTCTVFQAVEVPKEKLVRQKSDFRLPTKNSTYKHIFAYLVNVRKLDAEIVQQFVKDKKLYEDLHNNCVFVGYDDMGIARFASMRGTNTHIPFKGNPPGSDKRYPVCWTGTSDRVYVFEAPIDMLSFMTLMKKGNDLKQDHFISLAGLSLLGLDEYLKKHRINYIGVCTDFDKQGIACFNHILLEYGAEYTVKRLSPKPYKDFNLYLTSKCFQEEIRRLQQGDG